jgi:putative salt-induced outer membrane protein YdiY
MTPRFAVATMTMLALLTPAAASAQEERNFGITMGFPASVGVFWKVSDAIAVRPEFRFSLTSENDDEDASLYGTGVTGLFYLGSADALRLYAAPRFTYERQNTENRGNFTFESAANVYALSGLFGAQYLLGDRFLVYGEVGVRFGYASSQNTVTGPTFSTSSDSFGHTWGSTGGVGIVLLF